MEIAFDKLDLDQYLSVEGEESLKDRLKGAAFRTILTAVVERITVQAAVIADQRSFLRGSIWITRFLGPWNTRKEIALRKTWRVFHPLNSQVIHISEQSGETEYRLSHLPLNYKVEALGGRPNIQDDRGFGREAQYPGWSRLWEGGSISRMAEIV